MQFVIDLSPAQAERLRLEAERLGVKPEELAKAILADVLDRAADDFTSSAAVSYTHLTLPTNREV